ncbi:MAG: hypothetical protein AAF456_10425 [Planctomycetota bacterium]
MAKTTRRAALKATLLAGTVLPGFMGANNDGVDLQQEEELALAAGMTAEEAACWRKLAEAASMFLQLPAQHGMDTDEAVSAFHVIQNKLLARPTYRKYVEAANADR